jgi:hypothetical protein
MYCSKATVLLILAATSEAFNPSSLSSTHRRASTTAIKVSVDPEVVTKKEYQDICGVDFDSRSLEERLKKTNFLYPKHVEVIEDFAPLVDKMVDEIVSSVFGEEEVMPYAIIDFIGSLFLLCVLVFLYLVH